MVSGVAVPRDARPAGRWLLHISDPHIDAGGLVHGAIDSAAVLTRLLDRVIASGRRPDALVFTGDLTNRGDTESTRLLHDLAMPRAERLETRVIWANGNHDDRAVVRTQLLGETPSTDPIDRIEWLGGLRIVVLDTTIPDRPEGTVTDAQCTWLAGVLADRAPDGSLLVMHHPPLPCPIRALARYQLDDTAALAAVLGGSDVRAILSGHVHHPAFGMFADIPVSVASSVSHPQDLLAADGTYREQAGAWTYNHVYVYPETVVHAVDTLDAAPTAHSRTADGPR